MEQASPYGFCMRIKLVGENCGVQIEKTRPFPSLLMTGNYEVSDWVRESVEKYINTGPYRLAGEKFCSGILRDIMAAAREKKVDDFLYSEAVTGQRKKGTFSRKQYESPYGSLTVRASVQVYRR